MNLRSACAFTKLDVIILVASAGMLALWILYGSMGLYRRPHRSARVGCTTNLKQVALAFSLWQADQDITNFPWEVAAPIGTAADAQSTNVFPHFAAISNQLQNLRVLICPADKIRKPASSWGALRNDNISYFINVTPSLDVQSVIAGDRNLSANGRPLGGYAVLSDAKALKWTKLIHEHGGNVAMVDGSAHQTTTRQLRQYFTNTPIHLAIP
jgi:prepilin-type processing-associated H-X9-DG protein